MKTESIEARHIAGEAQQLLHEAPYGFLGVIAAGEPYVIPISFALEGQTVYLHGGRGKKTSALDEHPHACLTVVDAPQLIHGDAGCNVGFLYSSVVVTGPVRRVEDHAEKDRALSALVVKYHAEKAAEQLPASTVARTLVYALEISSVSLRIKSQE